MNLFGYSMFTPVNLLAGKNMRFRTRIEWSEYQIERLTTLWNRGTTLKTIAEEFRFPIPTIEAMVAELKLPEQPLFRTLLAETPQRHHDGCSWPMEKDGVFSHFCGANSKAGKPYCEVHSHLAYVKRRPATRDAAIHV